MKQAKFTCSSFVKAFYKHVKNYWKANRKTNKGSKIFRFPNKVAKLKQMEYIVLENQLANLIHGRVKVNVNHTNAKLFWNKWFESIINKKELQFQWIFFTYNILEIYLCKNLSTEKADNFSG